MKDKPQMIRASIDMRFLNQYIKMLVPAIQRKFGVEPGIEGSLFSASKTYHPTYMQQNVVIVDGDKASARIEARNMSVDFSGHMRSFLKDILLDGQTYATKNSYGTYDVRVKGEGFNNTDAPIVVNEIKEMGKAKDVKIDPTHIKGFKY